MSPTGASFIHLSDIHFTRHSGGAFDLDDEIRHELERDASELLARVGPPIGVLVTGDVAFSGSRSEYATAGEWLDRFTESVKCPGENVWVVPGNHDVDRSKANDSKTIRLVHERLRNVPKERIDDEIREICADRPLAKALFDPLVEYNAFAARYQCDVAPDRHYWERDIDLGSRKLRLRGLTSVLVSNADDSRGNLVLGSMQPAVRRADGIEYVTLCHHPPDWFRDQDSFTSHLESKVRLQLFGHKHSQRLQRINDGLRLTSGAMHPNRTDREWEPTYNVIQFEVRGDCSLAIRVYARRWHKQDRRFVRDPDPNTGGEYFEHVWRVASMTEPFADDSPSRTRDHGSGFSNPNTCVDASAAAPEALQPDSSGRVIPGAVPDSPQPTLPDPERRLTYRFLSLPFRHQIAIAQKLDLLTDEDRALADSALFLLVFRRAAAKQQLQNLWEETETCHGDGSKTNPFTGR